MAPKHTPMRLFFQLRLVLAMLYSEIPILIQETWKLKNMTLMDVKGERLFEVLKPTNLLRTCGSHGHMERAEHLTLASCKT